MKVSFSHYPKPFRAAIKMLKGDRADLGLVSQAFTHPPCMRVDLGTAKSFRMIGKKDIPGSGAVWFRSFLAPCFFIGAAVKDKKGMVARAVAGHFETSFNYSDVEEMLSKISPIKPDEKVNAFLAGSSQRITESRVLKNVNDIVSAFKNIGLPMQIDTDNWYLPVLSDVKKNNMIISDLGNSDEEEVLTRMVYFGVASEDSMLFCTHRIGEKIQRVRIITSDVGPIDL